MPKENIPLEEAQRLKQIQTATRAIQELEIIITSSMSTATSKTILDLQQTITTLRATGASNETIKNTLLQDLDDGGIIFGTYRNNIKNATGNAVQLMSEAAIREQYGDKGIRTFKWITAGGNVCADCEPRHGDIATWEEWNTIGMPRSGFSVCKHNCQCQLVPSTYNNKEIQGVVRRKERRKELEEKFRA
ncbi:MAG: hypothetical protein Unbinned6747contig1000_7 [Prokaryotic dsDNA virus sp.]|nr:MAG: hypothetical protein Unbinned6747contig1000_7 [Prokaryotic dsDNA virus sp.]|tara:strand:+ start:26894 stop:27463 length:570 start_codon:yes stop_codon:yes gene_type:complete